MNSKFEYYKLLRKKQEEVGWDNLSEGEQDFIEEIEYDMREMEVEMVQLYD